MIATLYLGFDFMNLQSGLLTLQEYDTFSELVTV